MLLGIAFGHNNANTTTVNDNIPTTVTSQSENDSTDLGEGTDTDPGGPVGGNSGQTPPPSIKP